MFKAEGLEVTLRPHVRPWSELIGELIDGTSEIVLGNIWFAMQSWRSGDRLLPIAHCVRQSGSVVVGKRGMRESFEWKRLEGKIVAVQSDVPTPWIAFRESLRVQGVPADRVRLLFGLGTTDAIDALRTAAIDFAVLHVDRTQHEAIEEVAALADVIGPVPWSVFMAGGAAVEANPEPYRRFQRAIGRALQWMATHESRNIAEAIAPRFPQMDADSVFKVVERHRRLHAWPSQPQVVADDVARWQEMLVRWGLLAAPVALEPLLRFMPGASEWNAQQQPGGILSA